MSLQTAHTFSTWMDIIVKPHRYNFLACPVATYLFCSSYYVVLLDCYIHFRWIPLLILGKLLESTDGHPYKARNVQVRICQRRSASGQIVAEYWLLFHAESIWATDSLKIESIAKMQCTVAATVRGNAARVAALFGPPSGRRTKGCGASAISARGGVGCASSATVPPTSPHALWFKIL